MNSLKRAWKWTKDNLDWVCIGANAVIVAVIIFYTVQSTGIVNKLETQNLQLFERNTQLIEYNKALNEVVGAAIKSHNLQQQVIKRQKDIIDMQNEAGKKLFERNKYLEALLNGNIT